MTRLSKDEIRDGRVWRGFDYNLQVRVDQGIVQDCGHPDEMKRNDCCNAHRLAGQHLFNIPGAEVRSDES